MSEPLTPTRYRTRSVEVEAVQLRDDADWTAIAAWCGVKPHPHTPGDLKDQLPVNTPEGVKWANVDDWIIRDADGRFDTCEPDTFVATYVAVSTSTAGQHDPNEHWSLAMAFPVVASRGGRYDDESYCAGFESGRLDAALQQGGAQDVIVTVHTPNALQIDMIGMRHGYAVGERTDHDDGEWTTMSLRRSTPAPAPHAVAWRQAELAAAQIAVARGLALCQEYATHHPASRPLATQTAVVFRRALTGEGDQRWLEELAAASLTAALDKYGPSFGPELADDDPRCRTIALRSALAAALQESLPYIEGWTAELTTLQVEAVVDALLGAAYVELCPGVDEPERPGEDDAFEGVRKRIEARVRLVYDASCAANTARAAMIEVAPELKRVQTELAKTREDLQAWVDDHAEVAKLAGECLGLKQPLPVVTSIGGAQAIADGLTEARAERDHWKREHDELTAKWAVLAERTIVGSVLLAEDMPADVEAELAPHRLDLLRKVLAGEAGRDDVLSALVPRLAEAERHLNRGTCGRARATGNPCPDHDAPASAGRPVPSPEDLGRAVRDEWVAWARQQPDAKPSWLVDWDDIDDEVQREVDKRIAQALYTWGRADGRRLTAAAKDVLRIVEAWCIEANNVGGVDAGDLAWRLEQAGYPFPDAAEEEDTKLATPSRTSPRSSGPSAQS
jgi:hypothetical protein